MNPNTKANSIPGILSRAEKGQAYWEEAAILDFTEEVLSSMEKSGVTRTELAKRLEVDPAYVTKLIGGSNNFTLKTMVKLARALDSKLRFHLQPKHAHTVWTDYTKVANADAAEVMISLAGIPDEYAFHDSASYTDQGTFHVPSAPAA